MYLTISVNPFLWFIITTRIRVIKVKKIKVKLFNFISVAVIIILHTQSQIHSIDRYFTEVVGRYIKIMICSMFSKEDFICNLGVNRPPASLLVN